MFPDESVWQDVPEHLALLQDKADARLACISAVSTLLGQGWGSQAGSKIAPSCVPFCPSRSLFTQIPVLTQQCFNMACTDCEHVLCDSHFGLFIMHRLAVGTAHFTVTQTCHDLIRLIGAP